MSLTPTIVSAVLTAPMDAERTARTFLTSLQDAFTQHDLAAVTSLFDDELVLFGSASANVSRAADRAQTEHGWRLRHFHGSIPQED